VKKSGDEFKKSPTSKKMETPTDETITSEEIHPDQTITFNLSEGEW
jgi:hypothetical protein